MFLGRVLIAAILVLFSTPPTFAQESSTTGTAAASAPVAELVPATESTPAPDPNAASTTSPPTPAKAPPPKKRVVSRRPRPEPTRTSWQLGAVYLLWSERLSLAKNGVEAEGFANYGGIGLALERTWATPVWHYSAGLTFGVGKASSDGFGTALSYVDGVDKPWTAFHFSGVAGYRINPSFSIGPGLLARSRTTQWKSTDAALQITPEKLMPVIPELVLRWTLLNEITLMQTFAPLNAHGDTLWQWNGQWIF